MQRALSKLAIYCEKKRKATDSTFVEPDAGASTAVSLESTLSSVGSRLQLIKPVQEGAHGRVFQAKLTSSPDDLIAVKVTCGAHIDSRREVIAVNSLLVGTRALTYLSRLRNV